MEADEEDLNAAIPLDQRLDDDPVSFDKIESEPIDWLCEPYIAKRKIALLGGEPDCGKTYLALAIAAGVIQGRGLPGQPECEAARILYLTAEDKIADTLKPRLIKFGLDESKAFGRDKNLELDDEGFDWLRRKLARIRPALLVLDPLQAFMMDVAPSDGPKTRRVMEGLTQLATDFDLAVLCITHPTKGASGDIDDRFMGNKAIRAHCRSMLLAGVEPATGRRVVIHRKSNLAGKGPSQEFYIDDTGFYWRGPCDLTAEDLRHKANAGALVVATDFVKETLGRGSMPSKELEELAKARGIAAKTLSRARAFLGVHAYRVGEAGKKGGGHIVCSLTRPTEVAPAVGQVNGEEREALMREVGQPATVDAGMGLVEPEVAA